MEDHREGLGEGGGELVREGCGFHFIFLLRGVGSFGCSWFGRDAHVDGLKNRLVEV